MSNAVVQWQLLAKDPEAVSGFYSELFGWTVDRDNPLGYRRMTTHAPGGIDGGVFVQLFIAVEDVASSAAKAVGLGATILVPPQNLPDGDEMAILLGPENVSFGLVKGRG